MNNPLIRNEVELLLKKLTTHGYSPLFMQEIEEIIQSFPNYSMVIEKPIDLLKISRKFENMEYSSFEEFSLDVTLMFENCKTFNCLKKSWAHKAALVMEGFFNREFKKSLAKIQRYKTMPVKTSESFNHDNLGVANLNDENLQVVSSSEDDKIYKRIKNLFLKLGSNLNVTDEQREEILSLIVKSIMKRSKSFEQIYEDTMKFLSKNLNNVNGIKTYFSRKFRKLLRAIKEEQSEGNKEKVFNIKINLNDSEENREEKDKLDVVRKEVISFIDNQKIPEVFRNVDEYPIEPSLRKKITLYINEIKSKFMKKYN